MQCTTMPVAMVTFDVGLQVFEFEYDFTSTRLTSWDATVLQLAGIRSTDNSQPNKSSRIKGNSCPCHYL